ncbi:hypothetical protein [Intrasporangium sp.]|uniref:hypothetical protein n=1 Tax=Intrasporangium sp. TaxID=1925024 RepID=UPI00322165FB
MTRVDPGWLALRGPADFRARTECAAGLAEALGRWLCRRRPADPARLVDVGAGTGAGAAWLRPRLGLPLERQRWWLVDHDPDLLARAEPVAQGWAVPVVADLAQPVGVPVVADLAQPVGVPAAADLAVPPAADVYVPAVADLDVPVGQTVDAVTCQALLDLLTPREVHALVGPAVDSQAAVLAGLTVTGRVDLRPVHPADELVGEAFNAHQRRADRLGPDAGEFVADLLRDRDYAVTVVATPWCLREPDRELAEAWLCGRAEAAVEQQPRDAARIEAWLADRLSWARSGRLDAEIGHVDVLGLPPSTGSGPARVR